MINPFEILAAHAVAAVERALERLAMGEEIALVEVGQGVGEVLYRWASTPLGERCWIRYSLFSGLTIANCLVVRRESQRDDRIVVHTRKCASPKPMVHQGPITFSIGGTHVQVDGVLMYSKALGAIALDTKGLGVQKPPPAQQ